MGVKLRKGIVNFQVKYSNLNCFVQQDFISVHCKSRGKMTPFCEGDGHMMLMGFQLAFGEGKDCINFLFMNCPLNESWKYVLALIGVFLMAVATPIITSCALNKIGNRQRPWYALRFIMILLSVTFHYWLMLLIMTYEALFFTAIVIGWASGRFIVECFEFVRIYIIVRH